MLSFLYFMKFCSVISGSSTTGIRFSEVQVSMATKTILVFSCSWKICRQRSTFVIATAEKWEHTSWQVVFLQLGCRRIYGSSPCLLCWLQLWQSFWFGCSSDAAAQTGEREKIHRWLRKWISHALQHTMVRIFTDIKSKSKFISINTGSPDLLFFLFFFLFLQS